MKDILFHYLPYGAIDLLLTIAVISELVNKRYDLLWANLPIMIWGIISLNKKIRKMQNDLVD